MTTADLELTRKCAINAGYTIFEVSVMDRKQDDALLKAVNLLRTGDSTALLQYGDELMMDKYNYPSQSICIDYILYDPLHDDAQAMALVKRFVLCIQPPQFVRNKQWHVWSDHFAKGASTASGNSTDLNRAIVECVARLP